MNQTSLDIEAINSLLQACGRAAVAVSGGIDSLTLATLAARQMGSRVTMYHAVSPAVPPEATERVKALAAKERWQLRVIDAGEFEQADYMANPVNRCFYCKQSLYSTIVACAAGSEQVFSGTNTDDLQQYRPGLEAARLAGVRHPFVEAQVSKRAIRQIASALGLGALATLPASPCLSSRVETGIPISPKLLTAIDAAEVALRRVLGAGTLRCRYRSAGIVVELPALDLAALSQQQKEEAIACTRAVFAGTEFSSPVSLAPYRTGSAFLTLANDPRRSTR